MLCVPIVKQGKVLGVLYLENRLVPGTFTTERLAAVELLATQSAISVENAGLLAAERNARAAAEAAEQRGGPAQRGLCSSVGVPRLLRAAHLAQPVLCAFAG